MTGLEIEELSLTRCSKQPWLIEDIRSTNHNYIFIDPINSVIEEKVITKKEGKKLLGCFGEWVLLLDELTKDCNFLSLLSLSEIHIPPFLHQLGPDYCNKFSLSSLPDSPDCLITYVCSDENIIHFCGIYDKTWTTLPITDFDDIYDIILGRSIVYKGQLYIMAAEDEVLVFDIASMTKGCADKRVVQHPEACPITTWTAKYLVECCDKLFLVRVHLGDCGQMVTNIEIHYLQEENELSWDQVWDIGDNAFFLSGSYSTALCAHEAGVEPNCIYFVTQWLDGLRLYTFYLEDQTFTFSLLVSESSDVFKQLLWVFMPSRLKNIQREIQSSSYVKELNRLGDKCKENESRITFSRKWTDLPIELVELLFPRLSLVDCFRLSAVCKEWSLISDAVAKANAWPWLMHSPNIVNGKCKFFDPVNEREYTLQLGVLSAHEQLTFRFSKDGWVVVTKGNATTFILNPFTEEVIDLPTVNRYYFHGIAFTGIPSSLDFQVFGFYFHFDGSFIEVFSCRHGEEKWSTTRFFQIEMPFYGSKHNPVLYDGELYCLDKRGRLGVLDPNKLAWRVLSKPEPIYYEESPPEYDSCHLIRMHGDLIAVFKQDDTSAICVFKLDWSKMSWTKLGDLGDFALFFGRHHSIAASSLPRSYRNKIYLSKFDGRDHRMGAFYSMDDQTYHPRFYDLQEPTISVWLQPNIVPTLAGNVG